MVKVDVAALQFVAVFTGNLLVGFMDRSVDLAMRLSGALLLGLSVVLFFYVLAYLRGGFLGSTEPVLDHLVTRGPYRFCRHPLYLCFLLMVLGVGLYLGSWLSVAFTLLLSVPSAAYRAGREDVLLRERFGEEWLRYAERVGMFLPRLRR
ncbi:MAG TPA: isoprenylcysteine carboxylmethyltransferase family protein [Candidatus Desulfaltia sp.]|nr:isoprenylcysteine carboxylmethyltransferase family protein [Candidatus Desulfaltia sp.]